jgi:hypothetical protein
MYNRQYINCLLITLRPSIAYRRWSLDLADAMSNDFSMVHSFSFVLVIQRPSGMALFIAFVNSTVLRNMALVQL